MKKSSTPLQTKGIRRDHRGRMGRVNRAPMDACDVNTGPGLADLILWTEADEMNATQPPRPCGAVIRA